MNIYKFIKEKISPIDSPIVFELGVNLGQDTVKIFELCKNPQYYAFEPDPDHFETIKQLSIFNKIKFFSYAIGKNDEELAFYRAYDASKINTGSASLLQPKNHLAHFTHVEFPKEKQIKVLVKSLDLFCENNNINHIDFIWADIQGAEGNMILGGQEILKKTKYLYTEYCNNEDYENQKSLDQLLEILPGKWRIVEDYKSDVLFKNLNI